MSQSEIEKVSKALRDELAMGEFSQDFEPGEVFDATLELEDLDTLHVDVVPVGSDPDWEARGVMAWDNVLQIAIRKRFGQDDLDEATGKVRNRHMHELLYLEEEIIKFLVNTADTLRGYAAAEMSVKPEVEVKWSQITLRESGQFTSVIRVTYKTQTDIS